MPALTKEAPISPEQFQEASANYLRCLNLPRSSQVLIISDAINGQADDDTLIRTYLSTSLFNKIGRNHRVGMLKFDGTKSYEEMRRETYWTLKELEDQEPDQDYDHTTTIVYMGDTWANRSGMYHAAEDFGSEYDRTVRWAGSLGFTTGDARVMAGLTSEKMETIRQIDKSFTNFFRKNPMGSFEITTRGEDGQEHKLHLGYHTEQAPFKSDIGQFSKSIKTMISPHVQYINIPGGEKFASPFPFRTTRGGFVAEGMLFRVKNGLVQAVYEVAPGAKENKDSRQRQLIELIESGRTIPVSELGLGYYALIGIKTYSDSSILSREKGGPHIGFAHAPSDTTEEQELAKESGDFHHTDFVLDNPVLMHFDINDESSPQFYPPVGK